MKGLLRSLLVVPFVASLSACSPVESAQEWWSILPDNVERLGNPAKKRWPHGEKVYARNVWDLQVFDGRLYIGSGNSNNIGPAPNAGPVNVWSYDPDTGLFKSEATLREESLARFRVIHDRLYIPGWDQLAFDGWFSKRGYWYRLEKNGWRKYGHVPAIHVYDIAEHKGQLFMAGSHATRSSSVWISDDDGRTSRLAKPEIFHPDPVLHLFELGGELYGAGVFTSEDVVHNLPDNTEVLFCDGLIRYVGNYVFEPLAEMGFSDLFPDTRGIRDAAHFRITKFRKQLVYIGMDCDPYRGSTALGIPFGLFAGSSLKKITRIKLPDEAQAWDLLARDNALYVLLAGAPKDGKPGVIIRVLATPDLENWTEVLRFRSPTIARSFELLDGDFYFGLGDTYEDFEDRSAWRFSPATGEILRIRGPK